MRAQSPSYIYSLLARSASRLWPPGHHRARHQSARERSRSNSLNDRSSSRPPPVYTCNSALYIHTLLAAAAGVCVPEEGAGQLYLDTRRAGITHQASPQVRDRGGQRRYRQRTARAFPHRFSSPRHTIRTLSRSRYSRPRRVPRITVIDTVILGVAGFFDFTRIFPGVLFFKCFRQPHALYSR